MGLDGQIVDLVEGRPEKGVRTDLEIAFSSRLNSMWRGDDVGGFPSARLAREFGECP
jgi:hypothetical protein